MPSTDLSSAVFALPPPLALPLPSPRPLPLRRLASNVYMYGNPFGYINLYIIVYHLDKTKNGGKEEKKAI